MQTYNVQESLSVIESLPPTPREESLRVGGLIYRGVLHIEGEIALFQKLDYPTVISTFLPLKATPYL